MLADSRRRKIHRHLRQIILAWLIWCVLLISTEGEKEENFCVSVSVRTGWSTWQVPDQPGLLRQNLPKEEEGGRGHRKMTSLFYSFSPILLSIHFLSQDGFFPFGSMIHWPIYFIKPHSMMSNIFFQEYVHQNGQCR